MISLTATSNIRSIVQITVGVLFLLGSQAPAKGDVARRLVLAGSFEQAGEEFAGRSTQAAFMVSKTGFRGTHRFGGATMEFQWSGATSEPLTGRDATGGTVNYLAGNSRSLWRTGVARYGKVLARSLYPGIDALYYFQGQWLEFDIIVRPGANLESARLVLADAAHPAHWKLQPDGGLLVHSTHGDYRLRPPQAYQSIDGVRREVACRYRVDSANAVTFATGQYDRRHELTIDPVVEYLTYLGGAGLDPIQAIAVDSAGNSIFAGVTNSPNFPGLPATSVNSESIFVCKIDPSGSTLLYTTFLGSRPGGNPNYGLSRVAAIALDSSGNIYLTGNTYSNNFPITEDAWRRTGFGGFAVKLDSAGQLVYSTFLGTESLMLYPTQLLVADDLAYLAGVSSQREFYGTASAYQRSIAGRNDFFLLALPPDGSAPRFLTALGGSGSEELTGMVRTAGGNLLLAGVTDSADFPRTADAWPVDPPAPQAPVGVLSILSRTGEQLLYSTYLGTAGITAVTTTKDGDYVITGSGTLPDALVSLGPHFSMPALRTRSPGYVARFSGATSQPVWTTATQTRARALAADDEGALYWLDDTEWVGGGSFTRANGRSVVKLSSDGSRMLYASGVPDNAVLALGFGGKVHMAGYSSDRLLPTTPGVLQPKPDPAPPGASGNVVNSYDGWLAVLDLSSFLDANFFLEPRYYASTWRLGQPLPEEISIPLTVVGDLGPLSVTVSHPERLKAEYSDLPSPAIRVSVEPGQSASGVFAESVKIESANPEGSYSVPVQLTVLEKVDFTLESESLEIRFRSGQDRTRILPAKVPISTDFGTGYFQFSVSSSEPRFYVGVDRLDSTHSQLTVNVGDLEPGTYEGIVTIGIVGLPNTTRSLQVRCIVEPPAKITVSKAVIRFHVTKGQPFEPDSSVLVTGSVPDSAWSLFVGVSWTWMGITQTTKATPGAVRIMLDTAVAEVGRYEVTAFISGEDRVQIQLAIVVDVGSGGRLDVTPKSVELEYMRGGYYLPPYRRIDVITPTPVPVEWSSNQSWVLPQSGSGMTPLSLFVNFDSTLPEGVRQGTLTIRANGVSFDLPLRWRLYDLPYLKFPSDPIRFVYRIGGTTPPAQQIEVTCPTITPAVLYAGTTESPTFLKATQSSYSTPAIVTLNVSAEGLPAGTYQGGLSLSGAYPNPIRYPSIPVTLEVLPDPNAPLAALAGVSSAASNLAGAVSPGEILILSGTGLGPATPVLAAPGSDGRFPTALAGGSVLFDGVAAPILSASASQIKIVAPNEIAGRTKTAIQFEIGGRRTAPLDVPVAGTNPAVFTLDGSGGGLAAAQNLSEDGSASTHSAENPASPGGIVELHATGLGVTTPPLANGALIAEPVPVLAQSVTVLVGGRPAQVLLAGPEPGQVAGAMRVRVRLPAGVPTGRQALLLVVGENPSQPGVTLAVR